MLGLQLRLLLYCNCVPKSTLCAGLKEVVVEVAAHHHFSVFAQKILYAPKHCRPAIVERRFVVVLLNYLEVAELGRVVAELSFYELFNSFFERRKQSLL